MTVFKIDLTTGDLSRESGSLVRISGLEEIRQDVWLYLQIVLGEIAYDTNAGVPYVGEVTDAGTPAHRLHAIFRDAILSRPGIRSVLDDGPTLDFDPSSRKLSVAFRADTDEGELVFNSSSNLTTPGDLS